MGPYPNSLAPGSDCDWDLRFKLLREHREMPYVGTRLWASYQSEGLLGGAGSLLSVFGFIFGDFGGLPFSSQQRNQEIIL